MTPEEKIVKLLNTLPPRLCVKFALLCAEDVAHLVKDNGEAKRCRDLVKAWLEGKDVTAKEFMDAVDACSSIISSAAYSSAAAYYTIAYANATYTSFSHFSATHAASALNIKEDKYYDMLVDMIKDLSPLEQAIYNVEEM